ncbi:nuclear transport factor 2 family protein [Salinadaptatus halalkaliphilus]|uniref:Nuclear transport factor 2 family protein n=1 Tax=Salinadaptatus halalkaliphilus TaxID=2419781 RepID=A0A4S3TNB4_9EURY|nr:nuclear transport factor 2 family protein [Salinadaptatus halalkaliphilus]THE64595.1 nuclear transport factor 2 family protein [Salinadaptatus halalkaliphilus]
MEPVALVRQYYDALDAHDYETLESILDPAFVQHRPDRTFEGREAFVEFMREERPNPDTTHELAAVVAEGETVATRGRVLDDGEELFEYADFFDLEGDRIAVLETYSR